MKRKKEKKKEEEGKEEGKKERMNERKKYLECVVRSEFFEMAKGLASNRMDIISKITTRRC